MLQDTIVKGIRLKTYLTTTGNKKTVIVFLHDSLGCIRAWRDFPDRLAQLTACNILVYDRQGYGLSAPFDESERDNDYLEKEADLLKLLLDKHGIKDAILFGHSDGGSIALIFAAKHPGYTRAIVTEGAHIFVEDITLNGIREAETAYRDTDMRTKLQKRHGDKTDAVFIAWTKTWLNSSFRSWNIERFLPGIGCPVLVIQGENDEYGSLKQVEGIVEMTRGQATAMVVPGAAHSPHKEKPEDVLEQSARFVNQLIKP